MVSPRVAGFCTTSIKVPTNTEIQVCVSVCVTETVSRSMISCAA